MPWTNALPPDTRAVGTGSPAADMDGVVDAVIAMGAGYNVQNPVFAGGADPAGVADSTAAIQAAVSTGNAFFPPGTYLVSSTIATPSAATRIRGAGRFQATIKQASGANLDAVIADAAWLGSGTSSDGPISIEDLAIDGNKAGQSSGLGIGIALITFWNNLRNLEIKNTFGDGVRLSAWTRSGVKNTNSAVENHVSRVDVRAAGGYGIRVYDTAAAIQEVTDGWLIDCIIQAPALDGIRVDTSAGWLVKGNHLYGCPQHGIHMGRASNTRVVSNYVETWGTSATPGTYAGIAIGDGAASFIGGSGPIAVTGNTAYFAGGAAGGTVIEGIRYSVASTATANISVTGNGLWGNGSNTAVHGTHQSSTAASNVALSGNVTNGWASSWTGPSSGITSLAADLIFNAVAVRTGKPASGAYLVTPNGGSSSTSAGPWALGIVYLTPVQVQVAQGFSGLSTNITVAGAGGTTPLILMGLYNDDGSGTKPAGDPVTGSQVTLNPVTAGTGNLDVAFAGGTMVLAPGTYWAAWALTSGAAMTSPTMVTLAPLGNTALSTLANSSQKGWQHTGSSSASSLPAGIAPFQGSGSWPVIGLKAA